MAESLQKIRVQRAVVLEKAPGARPQFPKSTFHVDDYGFLSAQLFKNVLARGRSFFTGKLQVTGTSFTTSDALTQLTEDEERNNTHLTRLLIKLKPTIRIYACGNLAVPKLYVVRNSVTGDSATIDAKLAHLLFNIDEVTTHV